MIEPPKVDFLAPLWVWIMSALGGGVAYLEDFKLEDTWKTWLLKFLTKSSSSALAGLLTYHAVLAMNIGSEWHVIAVGIGAHMGTDALKFMGELWKARAGR